MSKESVMSDELKERMACPFEQRFLEAYYKAAETSQPDDWFQAALLAKQWQCEVARARRQPASGEPVGLHAVARKAADDALAVFKDSCNHTHQAIDYMLAVIQATLQPAAEKPEAVKSTDDALLPAVLALDAAIHKALIAGDDSGDELSDLGLRNALGEAQRTAYRALISIGVVRLPGAVNPLRAFLPKGEVIPAAPAAEKPEGREAELLAALCQVDEALSLIATDLEILTGMRQQPALRTVRSAKERIASVTAAAPAAEKEAQGDCKRGEKGCVCRRWPNSGRRESCSDYIATQPAAQSAVGVTDEGIIAIRDKVGERYNSVAHASHSGACEFARAVLAAAAQAQPAAVPDIDAMVKRFLGWKLPLDFNPDCGISFKRESDYDHPQFGRTKFEPVGTNLLSADQAKAMFKYCLGLEAAK